MPGGYRGAFARSRRFLLAGAHAAALAVAAPASEPSIAPGGAHAAGGAPPSGTGPPAAPGVPAAGTRRMIERLEPILRRPSDFVERWFGKELLFGQVSDPPDARGKIIQEARAAHKLLYDGRTPEAAMAWERVRDLARRHRALFEGTDFYYAVLRHLAVAHLRVGEVSNCIGHHGAESCLLPIRGSGVHREPAGATRAIQIYTEILKDVPQDAQSRWLLNVAYMAVGGYPDKVPPAWRFPPQAFESAGDVGRFRDAAPGAGAASFGRGGGAILEDFDRDGYIDIMVSAGGMGAEVNARTGQLRYYRNNADGTFAERTREAGLEGLVGGLNMVQGDYDNDGFPDVLVLRGGWLGAEGMWPRSLLRNNGDGTFADVTVESGLDLEHPSQAAAWGDFDRDGWLDVFIAAESAPSGGFQMPGSFQDFMTFAPARPCQLWRNNKDGTFTDVAAEAGAAVTGLVKGAVWGDYDLDGWPDLYLSVSLGRNRLLRNNGRDPSGRVTFTDVSRRAGAPGNGASFATWFFDYDLDGRPDILAAGYPYMGSIQDVVPMTAMDLLRRPVPSALRLYRNRGDGTFEDTTRSARLDRFVYSMGANFGDIDEDGWPDLYFGTGNPDLRTLIPNRMFRNAGGRHFEDVTFSAGVGHLQKTHGVAFGDVDNDGDQDVYLAIGGAAEGDSYYSALFENPGHGRRWITLRLEGVRSSRLPLGARIKVSLEAPGGRRDVYASVSSGGSFGASTLQQELGLGDATRIASLEVTWPATGEVQRFEGVAMDRIYRLKEGGSLEPDSSRRLSLRR